MSSQAHLGTMCQQLALSVGNHQTFMQTYATINKGRRGNDQNSLATLRASSPVHTTAAGATNRSPSKCCHNQWIYIPVLQPWSQNLRENSTTLLHLVTTYSIFRSSLSPHYTSVLGTMIQEDSASMHKCNAPLSLFLYIRSFTTSQWDWDYETRKWLDALIANGNCKIWSVRLQCKRPLVIQQSKNGFLCNFLLQMAECHLTFLRRLPSDTFLQ